MLRLHSFIPIASIALATLAAAAAPGLAVNSDLPATASESVIARSLADRRAGSLDLVLMGIVGGGGHDSRAIILSKRDKSQQLYQVGDKVGGARITSIRWGRVVLSANGREEILDMSEAAGYRARANSDPAPGGTVPPVPQDPRPVNVVSTGTTSQLMPERVRLVLPSQAMASSTEGE